MVAFSNDQDRQRPPSPDARRAQRGPLIQPARRPDRDEDPHAYHPVQDEDLQRRLRGKRGGGLLPGLIAAAVAALALVFGLFLVLGRSGDRSPAPVATTPAPVTPPQPPVAAPSSPPVPAPPVREQAGPERAASTPPAPPSVTPPETGAAGAGRGEEAPRSGAAPSTPPPTPPSAAPRTGPPPAEVTALLARARSLIENGDISAARLLLQRAASGEDAAALFALAETYDPVVLQRWRVRGVQPDAERARTLYRQALQRGAPQARERLDALR